LLFSFTSPATPDSYTLSLHDALPISCSAPTRRASSATSRCAPSTSMHRMPRPSLPPPAPARDRRRQRRKLRREPVEDFRIDFERSEEHTSELQSRGHLVCRLLLEKKK